MDDDTISRRAAIKALANMVYTPGEWTVKGLSLCMDVIKGLPSIDSEDKLVINICGVPHKVTECEDCFDTDAHFGQIDYKRCVIRINKDLSEDSKTETLFHEVLHGMLVHLGYTEQSQDEQFVQALSNAMYQTFDIKTQ